MGAQQISAAREPSGLQLLLSSISGKLIESPSNVDLPTDIIREVLLRLPVKILVKLKCVCKDWNTLIKSQSFVNQHFVNKSNRERMLVFEPQYVRFIYADESSSQPDHLPLPRIVSKVMGPVNGVFCVVCYSGAMGLLNPATRQFKQLSLLSSSSYVFHGFGLDPLSGYYKVVSIRVKSRSNPVVRVYNTGTHSWRLVENVDILSSLQRVLRSKLTTYLNGVYYWVMQYKDNSFDVLAFNMSSDEFQIIQIPDVIRGGGHELELELEFQIAMLQQLQLVLVVYGDSIAILSYNIHLYDMYDTFIDMWVLENDGRWTKRSTFGPFKNLRTPLGFWKNNELMLDTYTAILAVYNITTHELRHVKVRPKKICCLKCGTHRAFIYKESLVSIKEEGDKQVWGDF